MVKKFSKSTMVNFFRKRNHITKKHLSRKYKKILIKSSFSIFLAIIFLCIQNVWKDLKGVHILKELKEYPTHKIHVAIDVDNKYIYTCLVYLVS